MKEDGDKQSEDWKSIKPTRTSWIVPYHAAASTIQVLDITDRMTAPYPSDEFEEQIKTASSKDPPEPFITVTRTARWLSKQFNVEFSNEPGKSVAEWSGGFWSSSSSVLKFPAESKHSSHSVTIEADKVLKFREKFRQR
jgi:hypothetical protein